MYRHGCTLLSTDPGNILSTLNGHERLSFLFYGVFQTNYSFNISLNCMVIFWGTGGWTILSKRHLPVHIWAEYREECSKRLSFRSINAPKWAWSALRILSDPGFCAAPEISTSILLLIILQHWQKLQFSVFFNRTKPEKCGMHLLLTPQTNALTTYAPFTTPCHLGNICTSYSLCYAKQPGAQSSRFN